MKLNPFEFCNFILKGLSEILPVNSSMMCLVSLSDHFALWSLHSTMNVNVNASDILTLRIT